ncbi:MAG TPA: hypothetical protein VFT22_25520 [Kofleriaceae bacterium]|nr:hypothetical protein [Kofleriaceae bacterium]
MRARGSRWRRPPATWRRSTPPHQTRSSTTPQFIYEGVTMFFDTTDINSLPREPRTCTAGSIGSLLRAAWKQLHDPAILGIGVLVATLTLLITLVATIGCGGGTPAPANGSISLVWSIADADGRHLTCDLVGARSVALRLRSRANGNVVALAFPCANSPGKAPVAAGLYDISFQLDAPDGTRIATAPDQRGAAITAGQVAHLAPITFTIATRSQLVLSIATGATTNCQSPASGGAGITGTTLTLLVAGGSCEPATFVRQRGTEQRGTYTVDCQTPQVATCIEKDETLTTSLVAGSYLIQVRGKVGAADCWQRGDTLEVSPGKPLNRALGLLHVNGPGC